MVINGNTSGATDKFQSGGGLGNCVSGSFLGPDRVYAVTPSASGMLTTALTTKYNLGFVHTRTACPGVLADEVACEYSFQPGTSTITFPVTGGTTYYVIADGGQNQGGTFTLKLTLM